MGDKTKRNEGEMMDYDTKCFTGKHNFLVQSLCNSKANCFASFASTEINPLFLDINEVKHSWCNFFFRFPYQYVPVILEDVYCFIFLGWLTAKLLSFSWDVNSPLNWNMRLFP